MHEVKDLRDESYQLYAELIECAARKYQISKGVKMKWFYKWLRKKINTIDLDMGTREMVLSNSIRPRMFIDEHTNAMNFSVTKANGGYVVQFSQYDKRTDRSEPKLHIVTDDKDLGEEIGKIISFESLRS